MTYLKIEKIVLFEYLFFFVVLAGLKSVSFFLGVFILCLGVWYGLGGILGILGVSCTPLFTPELPKIIQMLHVTVRGILGSL